MTTEKYRTIRFLKAIGSEHITYVIPSQSSFLPGNNPIQKLLPIKGSSAPILEEAEKYPLAKKEISSKVIETINDP
jgi:hypothetical protein